MPLSESIFVFLLLFLSSEVLCLCGVVEFNMHAVVYLGFVDSGEGYCWSLLGSKYFGVD